MPLVLWVTSEREKADNGDVCIGCYIARYELPSPLSDFRISDLHCHTPMVRHHATTPAARAHADRLRVV